MKTRIQIKSAAAGLLTLICGLGAFAASATGDSGGPLNARRADVFEAMQQRVDASGVPAGGTVPDVTLYTLDGKKTSLQELRGGQPLVLVTASITCPVSVRTCPYVEDLKKSLPPGVGVAMVYTEEAHPSEDGLTAADAAGETDIPAGHGAYAAPRTLEERLALARLFQARLKLDVPVYVDGMDNAFQQMIGSGPNSAFVIDSQGVLKLKQGWYAPDGLGKETTVLIPAVPVPAACVRAPASFGLVADIQYADKPDGGRGGVRKFRAALQRMDECVAAFNSTGVCFAVQLGDFVDSDRNYRVPQRPNLEEAMQHDLDTVLDSTRNLTMPLYHVIGNHDVDAGEEALHAKLNLKSFYYDFTSPEAPGWRFIVLNGMDGARRTIGPQQLAWLEKTLAASAAAGERVICFNHYSLVQAASPNHDILKNPEPVLELFERSGNVVAWFSGHDHGGGYALYNGIHFVTLPALVEADGTGEVRAVVSLYNDHLTVTGAGSESPRRLDFLPSGDRATRLTYKIPDTGQDRCFNATGETARPGPSDPFYGQDAQFQGAEPAYRDNGDGTVSDLNTGLMWTQDPGEKKTFSKAVTDASKCRTGGYSDWRLPSIKELYSLIDFRGEDPDPRSRETESLRPFIDNTVFKFQYGREEDGDRIIDSQFATSTLYTSTTMGGNKTMFGVNFADGRIKGYPAQATRGRNEKTYYALYVRDNPEYGHNRFVDNGDGTVTDETTGLTWQQTDSAQGINWNDALAYAEALELGGHSDWRLPNSKELQSLVDYSRSPDATGSAAIDPVFQCSEIRNEAGQKDFPFYWTGTTHISADGGGSRAVYVAFGRAMGNMHGQWMDVHGAGAQRSDPKEGNPADYAQGRGPQGDAVRILNYVRCVRGGDMSPAETASPQPVRKPSRETFRSSGQNPQESAFRQIPGSGTGRPGGFIKRLDRDGDGRVSRAEFDGPAEHFDRLDRNGDGYIDESEAPTGPPRRMTNP